MPIKFFVFRKLLTPCIFNRLIFFNKPTKSGTWCAMYGI